MTYTAEMTTKMVEVYSSATSDEQRKAVVEDLASEFEKSVPSVRAKLVREGVYVKAEGKTGSAKARKDALVSAIALQTGANEEVLDSLTKATREALVIVYGALNAARENAGLETVSVE